MSSTEASQTWPIILNLIAAVFGALGQYFYKIGAGRLSDIPIVQNWQLFAGVLSFIIVMILFVSAFRMGDSFQSLIRFMRRHLFGER
jgi:hypothetical protein